MAENSASNPHPFPSTIVTSFLGAQASSALERCMVIQTRPLTFYTDGVATMQLDLAGDPILGGQPHCSSSAHTEGNNARINYCQKESMIIVQHVSPTTHWERNMTRLRQRIQEVQELIREDLRDIEEPLRTLGNDEEHLSQEQRAQVTAARTRYEQLFQHCHHALNALFLPFEVRSEQREHEVQLTDIHTL